MKVVIVGGVAGGATAAARIRRLNEQAEIVVFVVMDALVKNVEIRILFLDAVRIDHDGVGRDFPLFGLFALFR